jgi:glycosyltransferase involved in cell wall biosynthesis
MKRKAFILFPDTWLAYSPSIINLAKVMSENGWQLTLMAFHDGSYPKTRDVEVTYVTPSPAIRKFVGLFKLFSLYRFFALSFHAYHYRKERFDMVVGVDSLGFLITRLFFVRPVYFSLHIRRSLSTLIAKKLKIERMIIQTPERVELTFRDCTYKPTDIWFIQNSPILDRQRLQHERLKDGQFKIVYFGNVAKNHYGIENCIELLGNVPDDFTLTLKGPITNEYRLELEKAYHSFVSSGRLIFNSDYIPQDEVITWLQAFDLGLCFYDEGEINRNDPNIITAPSGKLFNYLAAGLPVVGSKLSGLRIVSEFGAGILLENQNPKAIGNAVKQIRLSHLKFKQQSKQAALQNDFRVMADNFLQDFIKIKANN